MGPTYGPTPGPRTRPGAKGDGGPPLRAQGPGALGPPGRGWYQGPPVLGAYGVVGTMPPAPA